MSDVKQGLKNAALVWWYNILTEGGRNKFPKPKDTRDIEAYYSDPAGHTIPPGWNY